MSNYSKEEIEEAFRIDLLSYLQSHEPDELVRYAGRTYTTKTHDSLKISNGKWMWWSRGIGGRNAVDYLMKVRNFSFDEAIKAIIGSPIPIIEYPSNEKEEIKELLLPPKSSSNFKITEYLFNRGIDLEIINDCIKEGIIFESSKYHNVIFVGKDNKGIPRYAAYRSIGDKRILGDATGSDKHFSFKLKGSEKCKVHLFECAIDVLSYATLLKINGDIWQDYNLVSLAGVYKPNKNRTEIKVPSALQQYLEDHPDTREIYLHFDNDIIGIEASRALKEKLQKQFLIIEEPPPKGKDFNDFLCFKLGIKKIKSKERRIER